MFKLAAGLVSIALTTFIVLTIAHRVACPPVITGPECTPRNSAAWQTAKEAFGSAADKATLLVDEARTQERDTE